MNPHLSTPSNHLKQIHPSQIKPYSFHLYSTHLNSIPSHPIRTQIANPSESLTHFPPTTHFQAPATTPAGPASQLALAALGGYCLPSNSTFGSQVHRSSAGTLSMTDGMCLPQPHQVAFWQAAQVAFIHILIAVRWFFWCGDLW